MLLFSFALALAGNDPAPPAACDVALAFVELRHGGKQALPLVMTPERESLFGWNRGGIAAEMAADPPPAELIARLEAGLTSALLHCPGLPAELEKRRIAHGRDAAQRAAVADASGRYGANVISVALPVLSADGNQALVAASTVRGQENGEGEVFHLRRQTDGSWRIVARAMTWIS